MFLRVFVAYYRLLVFLLLTCGASHVLGEDIVREGVITDVKDEIGKLIHLRPVGNRQGIDREHWEKMTGSKTDEEKEQDQIDAMVKRGIPMKIAKQMVEQGGDRRGRGGFRRRGFGGDFLTDTAAGQLFEELKIASGAMSGGGGGGPQDMQWDGRGEGIHMALHIYGEPETANVRFVIQESEAPFQEFVVEDHHVKGLRFQFASQDRQLLFSQKPDGKISVAQTHDTDTLAFQSPDYDAMVVSHPGFAKDFHSILESLGVNVPFTKYDRRVVQTIPKVLPDPRGDLTQTANQLIEKLGSVAFDEREVAEKQLAENFGAYSSIIEQKLLDDGLDSEIRLRLVRVRELAGYDPSAAERFIQEAKLLEDVEYLDSILPELPKTAQDAVREYAESLSEKQGS